ncbi:unnamed protein product [Prorocentrum cordatum]|uniref:Uncharacterized protein n=1 Tax=Prorocentrum cordatum TaxID=2364126 RepID=A0ABN9XR16_9DINO|nr:unnamed protein product [Polarella glacialis]CAK0902414.1 unnamed protein product [Polarella glacialis]
MRWLTSAWSSVPSRGGCGEALAASRTTSWSLAAATRWTTALTLTAATARRWASWRASWGATATLSARRASWGATATCSARTSIVGCDGDAYDGDKFGKDSIVGCDGDAFGKVPPFPTLSEVAVESELELKDAPAQAGALGQAVLGPRVACWADALEQQQAGEQCEQFVDQRDWDMVFLANSAAAARREAALDARAAAERLVQDVLVEMPVDVEAFGCKKKAKKKQHKKLLRADVVGATVGLDSVAAEDPRPPGAAGVWAFLEKAYAAGVPPDIAANLVRDQVVL